MKVELLAPAGSYESMMAAYKAGADAVYIGGARFGARAFADNLDTERMKAAIDYAHIRGKKLYLTVNTLLKQREIEEVYDYLLPFYREGLDAVIVQDFGVFEMVREAFPDMDLHASTQMTVTGVKGAKWLQQRGASRVVTARELSLEEIKHIHDEVPVEIESFVHGALCFCYSGQCLLSSMIGGRSGNRGRCAQPCRLPYQLYENGRKISREDARFLMSPKDMCTLDLIPDLVENGIYSFKMEGRMKKPEYTAGITAIYRKYIDLYLNYGRKKFHVMQEDRSALMDLYNRGGFSLGYYKQHNGKDMMSMERPNHWGTEAARPVLSGKNVKWKAAEDLYAQDILEFRGRDGNEEITLAQNLKKGGVFSPKIGKAKISKSSVLYRTRNEKLLCEIKKEYLDQPYKVPINGELILKKDMPSQLKVICQDQEVLITGKIVEGAQKRPTTEEEVRRQIGKLGQTDFQWNQLKVFMDEQVFVPMQDLNELRRSMAEELKTGILQKYFREEMHSEKEVFVYEERRNTDTESELTAEIQTDEQFEEILHYPEVKRIYISSIRYESKEAFFYQSEKDQKRCHEEKKECWYVMPWIFREEDRNYFKNEEKIQNVLSSFDGIMIKNLEEIEYLREIGYHGRIALDHNLYIWNRSAWKFWEGEEIAWVTLPAELTDAEMKALYPMKRELIVYGYAPLMVTAQCFQKNTTGCSRIRKKLQLKDRKDKTFFIKNDCSFCYNILYNSAVTDLADMGQTVKQLAPKSIRISFTGESKDQVRAVLERYIKAFVKQEAVEKMKGEFTRGHLKRGVE